MQGVHEVNIHTIYRAVFAAKFARCYLENLIRSAIGEGMHETALLGEITVSSSVKQGIRTE